MAEVSTMILVEGFGIRPRQRIHNSRFQFFSSPIGGVFWGGRTRVSRTQVRSCSLCRCTSPASSDNLSPLCCEPGKKTKYRKPWISVGIFICLINQQTWIKSHVGLPLWTWSTDRHLLQPQDLFQASPSGAHTAPGSQFKFFVQFQSILHHCRSKISTQSQSRWCRCRDIWCRNITFTPPAPEGQVGSSL